MQVSNKVEAGYYAVQPGKNVVKGKADTKQSDEAKSYGELLAEKRSELWNKIKNGETEETYQIGGQSFSVKEWERLLKRIDSEIETEEEEVSKEETSVEPYAALTAEIVDRDTFLSKQLSKVERRAEELKEIQKGIYEMQMMIDGQSMETLIEDQEEAEQKKTEEKKISKEGITESGSQEKKMTSREEIMEMMMSGTKPLV